MKRRQLLKNTATTIVGIGALPGLSVFLQSCGVDRLTDYKPVYFSVLDFDTLWKMAEIILPRTDTPGASDAGVAPFIDQLFNSYFDIEEKERLEIGLSDLLKACENDYGADFIELSESIQVDFMKQQESLGNAFFKSLKSLVMWAFFTSEVGMKSMNYQPVPGKYEGCIPLDPDDRLLVGNR